MAEYFTISLYLWSNLFLRYQLDPTASNEAKNEIM
jgi:hypothetical protein